MKKILRYAFLVAAAMLSTAAMADTKTVGAEDNTSAPWSDFSDYYTIAPNKTLKLKFKNYTSKGENWFNWLAVVTTDANRWDNENGYFEYVVVRADNFAYQPGQYVDGEKKYDKNTGEEKEPSGDTPGVTHNWYNRLSSNYNWDNFRNDMDGSTVEMTIERINAYVQIYAKITTTANVEYFEEFILRCGDGTENIRAFLTMEKAHLVIDNDATSLYDTVIPDGLVGDIHNSTKGWVDFSEYYTLNKNQKLTVVFENYSNKELTWNNWLLGVTTNNNRWDWDGGYEEYILLRADNFNVKTSSNTGITCNYNWDTFRDDMDGSTVTMTVTRDGADVKICADITTAGNQQYKEEFTQACGDGNQTIRAWLMAEGGHLIVKSANVSDATGINTVKEVAPAAKAVRYNVAGQQVDGAFKGLIIENGKKIVVK